MSSTLLVVFIIAVVAFSLSAVCGGGAGLLLMPVLGWYLPISAVPAALSIGTFSSSASRIIAFFSKIRWDIVRWFVPAAIPAVFAGVALLRFVNPLYLEVAIGIFLLSNLRAVFAKQPPPSNKKMKHGMLAVIGFAAGFLSGLTGAVGLLFNKFYLKFGLTKEEIVATRAMNEIILHLIKLVLYFYFGLITTSVVGAGLTIAVAAVLSSWVMRWGLPKISEVFFRRIGYASMVLAGLFMFTESGNKLFAQNNGHLTFTPINGGLESKLQWQQASFALEFEYDDGLQYEQKIPLSEAPPHLQLQISQQMNGAEEVIVEEVFGFKAHAYEAYFFKKGNLTHKIDLEG